MLILFLYVWRVLLFLVHHFDRCMSSFVYIRLHSHCHNKGRKKKERRKVKENEKVFRSKRKVETRKEKKKNAVQSRMSGINFFFVCVYENSMPNRQRWDWKYAMFENCRYRFDEIETIFGCAWFFNEIFAVNCGQFSSQLK